MDSRFTVTPLIAIIGRTNVGKSTLFNRLIEQKKAISSSVAGTTTDINFGLCEWRDATLTVMDTAGLDFTSKDATDENLKRQALVAMKKADLICFVVDSTTGLLPEDRALANYLQKTKKPVVVLANKADNPHKRSLADDNEWLKMGFGKPLAVSAANGTGVGDALDEIVNALRATHTLSKEMPKIDVRVAIIGRPNVGKSSLLNRLAGEERVIVSEIPHTTREPQDTLLQFHDSVRGEKNLLLIDTVGIRKKGHVSPGIEKIGVHLSLGEMERADVALLMVDAVEGVGVQEKRLAGLISDKKVGLMIVVNKWDLATEKNIGDAEEYAEYVRGQLQFLEWVPVIFMSAKTGDRVQKVLPHILDIADARLRIIPQEDLDLFTEKLKKIHHSAFKKGEKRPKVYGISQTGTMPPEFMVVVHDKETIHPNFLRFIENRMREEFAFPGTPIRVIAREIKN